MRVLFALGFDTKIFNDMSYSPLLQSPLKNLPKVAQVNLYFFLILNSDHEILFNNQLPMVQAIHTITYYLLTMHGPSRKVLILQFK
ncbi:hypothetical protein A359_07180 [secondary endosymbiont of Ctenarytaina eucalypti]|uniref:Uncharacterized protein n=1 Tax=secondary endosymbiont of Ctenarytaina eucalypti TaxID=1199245 RepID=J3TFP0_9ENTR|nr:hypothetical protein A359_07180 [secondary endosymbiont of Ctenarytaina eucalypti]